MAELKEDGTILYSSAREFLTEYRENITNNGLMVTTSVEWPLRQRQTFTIRVMPLDRGVDLQAEVVFVAGGQAGLEITADVPTLKALNALMVELVAAGVDSAAPPQSQPTGAAPPSRAEHPDQLPYQPRPSPKITQEVYLDKGPATGVSETQTLETVSSRPPRARPAVQGISLKGELVITGKMDELADLMPLDFDTEVMRRISLPKLVASISKATVPVSLSIEVGEVTYGFTFNLRGNLVQFSSPDSEDDLIERLIRAGKLNKELSDEVKSQADESKSAEEILLYRKIIRPHDYWSTVREQVVAAMMAIREGGSTPFSMRSEAVRRRTGIPFGSLIVPWMEVAMRTLPGDEVDQQLDALWYQFPIISESAPWPLQALDVEQRTLRFLEKGLDGRNTLIHVRKTSPLGTNRTKRLFCTLIGIGMMELREQAVVLDTDSTPEQKLAEELERLKKANRYDQLGVHWSAHPWEYTQAVKVVKKEYGSGSKWDRFYPESKTTCAGLIDLAEKAKTYLTDNSRRREYRSTLLSRFQQEVAAFHLYKQAELAIFREQYPEARRLIEMAIEMDAKKEYRALLKNC